MRTHERAWQVWPVLAWTARNRQLITYDILGKLTGMHAAGFGPILEQIQSYCLLKGLPPLSAVVVSKSTGLPSMGFVAATGADVPRSFQRVFDHDWLATACPTPDALEAAARELPSNGVSSAADAQTSSSQQNVS